MTHFKTGASYTRLTAGVTAIVPPDKKIVSERAKGLCLSIALSKGMPIEVSKDSIIKGFSDSEIVSIVLELINKRVADCVYSDGIISGKLLVDFSLIDVDRGHFAVTSRLMESTSQDAKKALLFFVTPSRQIDHTRFDFIELRTKMSEDIDWASMKLHQLTYDDYLGTPYWQILSHRVKQESGFTCVVCNATENLQCHHRKYPARGTEIFNHQSILTCLCDTCHSLYHEA